MATISRHSSPLDIQIRVDSRLHFLMLRLLHQLLSHFLLLNGALICCTSLDRVVLLNRRCVRV